jgi:hypothetical protein
VIPLPDLLNPRPTAPVDERLLEELLEMSYLGSDPGYRIDRALEDVPLPPSPWNAEFFADGLFLDELIEGCFAITLEGKRFPVHRRFLQRNVCDKRHDQRRFSDHYVCDESILTHDQHIKYV